MADIDERAEQWADKFMEESAWTFGDISDWDAIVAALTAAYLAGSAQADYSEHCRAHCGR